MPENQTPTPNRSFELTALGLRLAIGAPAEEAGLICSRPDFHESRRTTYKRLERTPGE